MIEDAKGDSCEMWRAIKQVLPGTKKSTVSLIFENGKWHTGHTAISQISKFNPSIMSLSYDNLE